MSSQQKTPYLRFFVTVFVLLILGSAYLLTEWFLYSQNTLVLKENWVSTKRFMQIRPMGEFHYINSRNALHRNRLNFDKWHGFQEVSLNKTISLSELDFDLYLDKDSYINVIYNRDSLGYSGFILSRNTQIPSSYYQSDRLGRFRVSRKFNPHVGDSNFIRLKFENNEMALSVDGVERLRIDESPRDGSVLGFRGGLKRASVDNVMVTAGDGTRIFESFDNQNQYWGVYFISVGFFLFFYLLVAALNWFCRKRVLDRRLGFHLVSMQFVLVVFVGLFYSVDYYFWSDSYPYNFNHDNVMPFGQEPSSLVVGIESLRSQVFDKSLKGIFPASEPRKMSTPKRVARALTLWNGRSRTKTWDKFVIYSGGRIRTFGYNQNIADFARSEYSLRIGFVGTSQTFGQGAETEWHTFVGQLLRRLSKAQANKKLEVINLSILGSNSTELLDYYKQHSDELGFDYLLVNLSFNDSFQPQKFIKNMKEFVAFNRNNKIKTVFILEPNTLEDDFPEQSANRKQLRELGQILSVPVWDLHGYLSEAAKKTTGVWWDVIHLNPAGHTLAAEWLAPQILEVIESDGLK